MNWPSVRLGEVLKQNAEYIETPEAKMYPKLSVKLYGKGVVLDTPVNGLTLKMQRHQIASAGQVILSEIWGKKGAIGFVPPEGEGALCTSHFFLFDVISERINPKWLQAIFSANYLEEQLNSHAKGTTGYAAIRPKNLLAATIPLPSLAEQRRIVARVDELAARIESVRTLRGQSLNEIELVFASRLSQAYDHAATLADGVKLLDETCDVITDGTHATPNYVGKGVPFLSIKDISAGRIHFDKARRISLSDHQQLIKRCHPQKGDVLLTKIGTTGIAKAIDVDEDFSIFVSIALLKLKRGFFQPRFVEYMLNSPQLRHRSKQGTRGVGNQNLVLKTIKQFPMPVPTLNEQEDIVAHLDALQAKVHNMRELQRATAAELDALLPSILDKAFKGEL